MVRLANKEQSKKILEAKQESTRVTAEAWAESANGDAPTPIKKRVYKHKVTNIPLRLKPDIRFAIERRAREDGRAVADLLRELIRIGMRDLDIKP